MQSFIFRGLLCLLIGLLIQPLPLCAQDFILVDTLIPTDELRVATYNYMEAYYIVPLRIANRSGEALRMEGYTSSTEEVPEYAEVDFLLKPYETKEVRLRIPYHLAEESTDRVFQLVSEATGNKTFRLRGETQRPLIEKSPDRWTRIRETQRYPLKITIHNPHDQLLTLDSLLYQPDQVDKSYQINSWTLRDPLPPHLLPGASVTLRLAIDTEGLFATVGFWLELSYHWPGQAIQQAIIVHAFAVEPNVWVEQGGVWELDTLEIGDFIEQEFWITNESTECLSLSSEAEQIVWTSVDTLCPGDTAIGYIRYDTRCDKSGPLDIELALFIEEFNGHVPLSFSGWLTGEQVSFEAFLVPEQAFLQIPYERVKEYTQHIPVVFHNRSQQTVVTTDIYERTDAKSDGNASVILPGSSKTLRIESGTSLQLDVEWKTYTLGKVSLGSKVFVHYTTEECPLMEHQIAVSIEGTVYNEVGRPKRRKRKRTP